MKQIDAMIETLADFYQALGYTQYYREELEQMDDEEIVLLYEMTFPNED